MSGSNDLGLAKLKADLATAHARIDELEPQIARGVRQRRQFLVSQLCLVVAVVVVLVLFLDFLHDRGDSRRYYNQQIRQLVCSVPPVGTTANELRARYECGAYVRPTDLPNREGAS